MAADDPKVQVSPLPSPTPAPTLSATPVATRLSAADFARLTRHLDTALVALVLLFTFLSASFAVRNSDFYQSLAVGRLIAQGQYEIGKDPFSFATEGVRWVNHSWLYSYGLYLLYQLGSSAGMVLVALKALSLAGLAGILLALARRPGQRWLIPTSCIAVAMLALSARVLLQPVIVSYLFLGLTLLILRWPRLRTLDQPGAVGCYWLLPPLFALWVNCDQWFFLGPLTAGIYWLGEYLQDALAPEQRAAPAAGERRTLGYAVLAGAAACLLNPHHVFALTLPAQLGLFASAGAASKDLQLQALFVSPLDKFYWTPVIGLSAAGIAYFVLLAAGLVSFALSLHYQALRYWRVFLFVPFALLSLYHARAIPFFAIIAGPIVSLNFLDFAASRLGNDLEPERFRHYWLGGRVAALLLAVALVVCGIPGWTQAQPFSSRHIAWKIQPDESLERTCLKMAQWRRDGLIEPQARWFNVSPDVLNYMAWFCPGERGFLDLRLALYDQTITDYVDVRSDLFGLGAAQPPAPNQPAPPEAWPAVFKKHNVDYVVIYNPDPRRLRVPLVRLLGATREWTPLSLDGHTLVFAWNKGGDVDTRKHNEQLRFDLIEEAFGVTAEKAPLEPPSRPAVKRDWYTALWEAPLPHQEAVDDALIYSVYHEILRGRWEQGKLNRFQNLVAVCGTPAAVVVYNSRYGFQNYKLRQDPLPPPALYVALRALRRCLHKNPDDPQAYLMLGHVYMALFWQTQEQLRTSAMGLNQVALIRQTQVTWALNKAAQLNPDLEEPHALLTEWYQRCRDQNVPNYINGNLATTFLDTELRHAREWIKVARQSLGASKTSAALAAGDAENAPTASVSAAEAVQRLEQSFQGLDAEVKKRQDQYEIKTANKSVTVIQRAQVALELGLGDEALTVLRNAAKEDLIVTQNGDQIASGAIMEMKLLLAMGETDGVRELLDPAHKEVWRGLPEFRVRGYDWFRLLAAAATGDYKEADEALADMQEFAQQDEIRYGWLQQFDVVGAPGSRPPKPTSRQVITLLLGQVLLNEAPAAAGMPWQIQSLIPLQSQPPFAPRLTPTRPYFVEGLRELTAAALGLEADLPALRGWLDLEVGDTAAAREHFNAALTPGVNIRSQPLATMGLYYLERADAKQRHLSAARSLTESHPIKATEAGCHAFAAHLEPRDTISDGQAAKAWHTPP